MLNGKVKFIRPDHFMIEALAGHTIRGFDPALQCPHGRMSLPDDWPFVSVSGHRYVIYLTVEQIAKNEKTATFILRNLASVSKSQDGFVIGISLSQLANNPALQREMTKHRWPVKVTGTGHTGELIVPKQGQAQVYEVVCKPEEVDLTDHVTHLDAWLAKFNGFDWWYQMSDSPSVWRRGDERYNALIAEIPKGHDVEYMAALAKIRPKS